ncbi:MAG: type II restriction endonuclease, partial [Cloacibacterium sp.]|nr:type II restriction endonuclease [Cloacibacterium sp.]
SVFVSQNSEVCQFTTSESWVILSPIEQSIKRKIEVVGKPLKDWDINIYRGILTGYNEAFIINGKKKDELIAEDPKSAEIIRPILRGRDIKRYSYDFADLWLIYVPWHFPLHNDKNIVGASIDAELAFQEGYPAVYNHLLNYKEALSNRNKSETGIRYEWYALQRWGANYSDEFSKQKIIYPNMTKFMPFVLDYEGHFTNQKCFIITGEKLSFLTAFFNSKIFKICYRDNFPELQGGTRELSKVFFENVRIPDVEDIIDFDFEILVKDLQSEKDYADMRLEKALLLALDLSEYEDFISNYHI